MNEREDINENLAKSLITIVSDITNTYSEILIKMAIAGDRRKLENKRHEDNFLSEIDTQLHAEYKAKIAEVLPSFIYASEEGDPQVYPSDTTELPSLMVLVDPLDTSELAVRGLCGYTHVLVYSLEEQSPIVSIVGDMFHKIQIFYAFRDREGQDKSYLITRGGQTFALKSSQEENLSKALVTNYLMRPKERFQKLADQHAFLDSLSRPDEDGKEWGRIGVDFGSIGLCHIAAGFTDAMVEIAKGFALWDLLPGQYILRAAGGAVASLDGSALHLNLNIQDLSDVNESMKGRQKFVAAGNNVLLNSIVKCFN